jgi:predicted nuclease of restriction endonuclease-like (RecB) superfamily
VKPAALTPDYATFLTDVKSRIQTARLAAGRAVNRELVLLYWDIGRGIVEKQNLLGWGDSVVEALAKDLGEAFPGMRGFSASSLWRMRQLYSALTAPEFLAQLARELAAKANQPEILAQAVRELVGAIPWGHHVEMLNKLTAPAARLFYLRATAQFGWSRAVLLNQIKAQTFERTKSEKKTHNFAVALPEHFAEQADEMLKSRYNLEFLGLARPMRERELEDKLIGRLQHFISELGYGFCFVGRQYRLALGQKEYFVDLLFYHRFLKTLVAFDFHPVR